MKKTYQNPAIKVTETQAVLMQSESVPKTDKEVDGSEALGKGNAWGDIEEGNVARNLWDE